MKRCAACRECLRIWNQCPDRLCTHVHRHALVSAPNDKGLYLLNCKDIESSWLESCHERSSESLSADKWTPESCRTFAKQRHCTKHALEVHFLSVQSILFCSKIGVIAWNNTSKPIQFEDS